MRMRTGLKMFKSKIQIIVDNLSAGCSSFNLECEGFTFEFLNFQEISKLRNQGDFVMYLVFLNYFNFFQIF